MIEENRKNIGYNFQPLKKDCIIWEECSPEEKVMKKI